MTDLLLCIGHRIGGHICLTNAYVVDTELLDLFPPWMKFASSSFENQSRKLS